MTERPILFSGPMVRAILDGHKTQTRRVVDLSRAVGDPTVPDGCKLDLWFAGGRAHYGYEPPAGHRPQWQVQRLCSESCTHLDDVGPYDGRHPIAWGPLPFWPGLRLWVRETLRRDDGRWLYGSDGLPIAVSTADHAAYAAWKEQTSRRRYCPSIYMPRWASRITLEVVSVRVERLQSITEKDARAEGVEPNVLHVLAKTGTDHLASFKLLWDRINGERAPWASNPWVWRVEFCAHHVQERDAAIARAEAAEKRVAELEDRLAVPGADLVKRLSDERDHYRERSLGFENALAAQYAAGIREGLERAAEAARQWSNAFGHDFAREITEMKEQVK